MGYQLDRFSKAAAPVLQSGETIVGGIWGRTPGSFANERVLGPSVGAVTQLGTAAGGDLRLPKSFEVAVTDRRLLFFQRSFMTGRPGELVLGIDLTDVVAARLTGEQRGIHGAAVHLSDGRSVELEVAKMGAKKLAAGFVAAVEAQLAAVRST